MDATDKVLLLLLLLLSSSLSAPMAKANLDKLLKPRESQELDRTGYKLESDGFNRDCIDSINQRRLNLGLNLLRFDQELALVAQKRANLLADGAFAKANTASRSLEYWAREQSHQNMDQSWQRRNCPAIIGSWCSRVDVNASRQYLESRDEAPNCPYVARAHSHRIGCAQAGSSAYGFFTVCQFNKPAGEQQEMAPLQLRNQFEAENLSHEGVKLNEVYDDDENEKEEGLEARRVEDPIDGPDNGSNSTKVECHFSLTRDWNKLNGDEKSLVLRKAISWHMKASGMTRWERIMLRKMIDKHDSGLIEDY